MGKRLEAGGENGMRRETRFTSVQPATWKRVYERDNKRCVLCGTVGTLQAAHFVPRSHGGLGREMNLVMLCADCHRRFDQSAEREEIRGELREYLQGLYPDWNEADLKYRKDLDRC